MADYVKKRTHIINHPRFLEAGAVARDLYDWGMLWAGQLETDGEIPMSALLASPWGAGGKRNVVIAQKLVDVGLWERTDTGFRILKWSEQGNVTKAELVAKREFDRARKARQRASRSSDCPSPESQRCPTGTPQGFPSSPSDLGPGRKDLPVLARPASGEMRRDLPLEQDARDAWDSVTLTVRPEAPIESVWLEFCGYYAGQSFPGREALIGRWQKWVSRQARDDAKERVRQRDRPSAKRPAEVTKQPFDPEAPWMKLGDTGS